MIQGGDGRNLVLDSGWCKIPPATVWACILSAFEREWRIKWKREVPVLGVQGSTALKTCTILGEYRLNLRTWDFVAS